ncbi:hypothetical protein ACWFMI_23940 [Nocardiopsis terrae]|uniref:hypothetical protein n=1 Tax=Streptomyces sp. NPDC057554 TaxID=3350538 RepID=UPI0036C0AD18
MSHATKITTVTGEDGTPIGIYIHTPQGTYLPMVRAEGGQGYLFPDRDRSGRTVGSHTPQQARQRVELAYGLRRRRAGHEPAQIWDLRVGDLVEITGFRGAKDVVTVTNTFEYDGALFVTDETGFEHTLTPEEDSVRFIKAVAL